MNLLEARRSALAQALAREVYERGPDIIIVGGWQHAILQAALKYQGRDRRRIKREMNKAGRRHRRNIDSGLEELIAPNIFSPKKQEVEA